MSSIQEVDIVMVGAGGGAYPAAFRLARAGMKVVMADPKGVMSGNCLAEGCVPSKTIREVSRQRVRQKIFHRFGIPEGVGLDYSAVVAHKDEVQNLRYAQHAAELRETPNIRLIKGVARLIDAHTVMVEGEGGEDRFRARHILISSGADISIPPIPGASHCLTSRDIYALSPPLRTLPSVLAVIGAGYIGLETASIFRGFGTQVTVFEASSRVLGGMDEALVDDLCSLLDPTIRILTNVSISEIRRTEKGVEVHYKDHSGIPKVFAAENVLLAAGRHPVVPDGVEKIGIELEGGRIKVDMAMRTTLPHIFATGDVNGVSPLFHAAVRQSLVAAHNILGGEDPCDIFDPMTVPTTVFTIPGAASVGLLPSSAKKEGIPVLTGRYEFSTDSRAQILGETGGGMTLLFDPVSLRLLGGTVVGVDAGNLIGEIGVALSGRLSAKVLAQFPGQHPMASEGIGKAARSIL